MRSKLFFVILATIFAVCASSFVRAADICGPQGCFPAVTAAQPMRLVQADTGPLPEGTYIPPRKAKKLAPEKPTPGKAHAMSRLPEKPLVLSPDGKLNPWEKGKVYDKAWREERLAKYGWYVLELLHKNQPYNPRLFEVVGKGEKYAKGLKNLLWQTVMVHDNYVWGLKKSVKMTARLIIALDNDDITGVTASAIMVVPKAEADIKPGKPEKKPEK